MSDTPSIINQPVGTVVNGNDDGKAEDTNGDQKSTARNTEPAGRTQNVAGFPVIDPFDLPANNDTGIITRPRRGRPPGSRNRAGDGGTAATTKTEAPANRGSLESIKDVLFSLHMMGAQLTGLKSLEITKEQSEKLADAIKNVAKHYPVGLTEKQMAWANLAIVAGGIYIPPMVETIRGVKKDTPKPGPVLVRNQTPQPTPAQPQQQGPPQPPPRPPENRPFSIGELTPVMMSNEMPASIDTDL